MARKHIIILVASMICVSAVIMALYAISPMSTKIQRSTFNRNFAPNILTQKAKLDLKYNSYYIAGISPGKIYLGNYTAPARMIIVDKFLKDTQHVKLKIKNVGKIPDVKKFRVTVDSPYFFLTHGTMPGIFRGNVNHWQAERLIPDSAYFVDAVPFDSSSVALRSYSSFSKAFELARATVDPPYFEFKYGVLKKQIDGIFCVEGNLHYNRDLKKIVYLYSYRNQFMVMDTDLNLVHEYHTIDTFAHANIKVASIKSNESLLTGLPAQINGQSCVSGKYLFIRSNLMAKNENEERFKRSAIIDVYNLSDGTYLRSFYINNYQNVGPSMFQVFGHSLIAIFDKTIIRYDLNYDELWK